jgi:hypothetical protein
MDVTVQSAVAVPRDGYRWIPETTTWELANPDGGFDITDPLNDSPRLFHDYAHSEPTPETLAVFMGDHGVPMWEERESLMINDTHPERANQNRIYASWELRDIQSFHDRLRSAVDLWESLECRDHDALAKQFKWRDDGDLEWNSPLGEFLHDEDLEPPLSFSPPQPVSTVDDYRKPPRFRCDKQMRHGDFWEPARLLLQMAASQSVIFAWSKIEQQMSPDGKVIQALFLRGLVEVMWLQLSEALTGERFRICRVCRNLFEVGTGRQGRIDKVFCSQKCQLRAHYEKKVRAREMRSEGAHLRTIAKELGTDTATVKGWVGEG